MYSFICNCRSSRFQGKGRSTLKRSRFVPLPLLELSVMLSDPQTWLCGGRKFSEINVALPCLPNPGKLLSFLKRVKFSVHMHWFGYRECGVKAAVKSYLLASVVSGCHPSRLTASATNGFLDDSLSGL